MKRLPKGVWTDTLHGWKLTVVGYSSKLRCYRIQYKRAWGTRWWVPVENFVPPRYQPPSAWDAVAFGLDLG